METEGESPQDLDARIVDMRDHGIAWKAIQETFGLTRQQARYAYQRGKRVERRAARRDDAGGGTSR
jgi:hypothetical protein